MKTSWHLRVVPTRGLGRYILTNERKTRVNLNRRLFPYDVRWVFELLRERKVPINYVFDIDEINFTLLPMHRGWTIDRTIMINAGNKFKDGLYVTLTHEIGHHFDELLDDPMLKLEHRAYGKLLGHYARRYHEFVAVGFEYFYGTPGNRKQLHRDCPILYSKILELHREYR